MKLLIMFTTSIFLLIGVATAQHANIGIKAGVNGYAIKNENNSDINPKLGFHLGIIGHFHLSDQFAIQPEVVFSTQGAKYTLAGNEINLNLNYVNVPILLQYMFDNGFRLQAGPQIGILTGAKTKIGNSEFNVNDSYETIDLGISIGVSYINPKTNFGVDLRYNHGLSDISKSSSSNIYNRGIQAGVFFLFNHK